MRVSDGPPDLKGGVGISSTAARELGVNIKQKLRICLLEKQQQNEGRVSHISVGLKAWCEIKMSCVESIC